MRGPLPCAWRRDWRSTGAACGSTANASGGGSFFEDEIVAAIRDCHVFLFVMTPDSVRSGSYPRAELARALSQKKPVIPLLKVRGMERPLQLEELQQVDFSGDFDGGLAPLLRRVEYYLSPAGYAETLRDRLRGAERELLRDLTPAEATRVHAEIRTIQEQLAQQPSWSGGIDGVQQETDRRILDQLQSARTGLSAGARNRRVINFPGRGPGPLPGAGRGDPPARPLPRGGRGAPGDRAGPGGSGKTALVCRVLRGLETGRLPDQGAALAAEGIVYLSGRGGNRLDAAGLLSGVARLLSPEAQARAEPTLIISPRLSVREKTEA